MGDNRSPFRANNTQAVTQFLKTAERSEENNQQASGETVNTITDEFIAVIESPPSAQKVTSQ
jgi:hypothetical protein